MYTFELNNSSDGWKITNVTTNDPWEKDGKFEYKAIDVKSAVATQLTNTPSSPTSADETKNVKENLQVSPKSSLYYWNYDFIDAVNYAKNNYNKTSNPIFGFTPGNDCQNFASQCVWAGLGGSSSRTARSAVSTSLAGDDAFNVWCRYQSTTYYDGINYEFNWAWDNVVGFFNLIWASTSSAEGPYGLTTCSNAIKSATTGNTLGVNWDGTASISTLDHAMFITGVTGTSGSRTTSNIKIAAHTDPTNSAYQVLSSYTSKPAANFGRATIFNGYYGVAQP